jgi:hypothetical protein
MKVEKAKALAELERFIRRFPSLAITTDDHPPEIVAEWRKAHDKVLADASSLTFSVHPVELEREGCDLLVNGVTTGRLAGAPIALPRGEHLIQARCGASGSWLQRLYVDGRPASVTIPVRAMVAARGNPETGGLILVAPQEGDAAALVTAVSQATGLDGAAVVTLNKDRVELGHQEPGLGDPTHGAWARLKGSGIEGWKPAAGPAPAGASKSGGGSSFGPWPWVVGGVGLAGVVTGVALNMAYVNEHDAGNTESLSSLQTGSLAGYIGGGALLAAGVVLFLLDDAAPAAAGTSAAGPSSGSAPGSSGPTVRAAPGGFAVRF